MKDEDLAKLIASDDLGLLNVKPRRTPQTSEEQRLVESFAEIARFVEASGSVPSKFGKSIEERRLAARLEAIRSDVVKCERLQAFDDHGILAPGGSPAAGTAHTATAPATIEDVLDDPLLATLSSDPARLFELKHVAKKTDSSAPDYVAQRQRCEDFADFEQRFQDCQAELRSGKRKLLPFANEQQIEAGKFFVLRGLLVLVAEIGEATRTKDGRWNPRLRCIFENGTECDLLLRSLSRDLYRDGRRVTERFEDLLKGMTVSADDHAAGYIYVLRSLSKTPEIVSIPHLYKIGLARGSIEERIRNAPREATYLMAPVAVVTTYRCFNLNLQKLERLLHRFFAPATLKVQVTNARGAFHTPKEWFCVPLETVELAVRLLLSGDIVHYRFDAKSGEVVARDDAETGTDKT